MWKQKLFSLSFHKSCLFKHQVATLCDVFYYLENKSLHTYLNKISIVLPIEKYQELLSLINFVNLCDQEAERKIQRALPSVGSFPNTHQEPRTRSRFPMHVAGTQVVEPSPPPACQLEARIRDQSQVLNPGTPVMQCNLLTTMANAHLEHKILRVISSFKNWHQFLARRDSLKKCVIFLSRSQWAQRKISVGLKGCGIKDPVNAQRMPNWKVLLFIVSSITTNGSAGKRLSQAGSLAIEIYHFNRKRRIHRAQLALWHSLD